MSPLTDAEIADLRAQAEDAVIWQDQWDTPSSDGSAVENWIDTASPETFLRLLASLDECRAGGPS
jgi:hypothetical protein